MFKWLNKEARDFLAKGYLRGNQTVEDRIKEICDRAEEILGISGFSAKMYGYMGRGWISLSSPVWANFGAGRGLPVSCNGSAMEDSMDSILFKNAEIGALTKQGAGTSTYLGKLRSRGSSISTGGKSTGPVHFAELTQTMTEVISQSNVRRGHCAVYLDIEHADINEFLEMREEGHTIQNLSMGVCVSDAWMQAMIDGDKDKRDTWAKVLKKRYETGYPYIFWTDTVNNNKPQVYKDNFNTIYASNMCTEIMLPASEDETFVCCLSSVNLLFYEDWKSTDLVKTLVYFLDAVLSDYITLTKKSRFLKDACKFAERHRAIGLGVLGWHSYLQSKMLAFESNESKELNEEIFKHIKLESDEASKELAILLGEPDMLVGYGERNTTKLAIAPTTSSSFILGQVSPSIEPQNSNYYVKDLAKGKFTYKNPYLKEVLKSHNKDNAETWKSILLKGGSVSHLEFLTENEKNVFKTFGEINQTEIIHQAAVRQMYIDQGQSLNLMIHPKTPVREVNKLLIEAWRLGVKTLYYQRGTNPAQELGRSLVSCSSCEG